MDTSGASTQEQDGDQGGTPEEEASGEGASRLNRQGIPAEGGQTIRHHQWVGRVGEGEESWSDTKNKHVWTVGDNWALQDQT